jgi:aromatic ring-opening dioxygenase catalytic subunit (LigB family)
MSSEGRLPAIYIPHGGGPWHVMKDAFGDAAGYERLAAYLAGLGGRLRPRTKALLVVSAHWEERKPTVHFGPKPGMLYDYYGFPEHTYSLSWPAPGDPGLAARTEGLLNAAGFQSGRETERGYDHGTFVPMMVAFPEANIPVTQLSLVAGLDPATHFDIGRALEPLRDEGVLIIGSGMSYHNMGGFMSSDQRVSSASKQFDDWLARTVSLEDPEERRRVLLDWRKAPAALECHPRSEHLVPLFLVAGAGGADPGRQDYGAELMRVSVSGHMFGQ